ncbi:11365_t:CDS:2 [Paraglomus brasilianum]|uniref:11365_t:CDS:1 n=1 Tax=Paraglomus brasilianum TaxID=144538 RepID=A0A9N9G0A0_9GLOM|nr:11365_t:CDS:2 [Paraglomus brasilianum]
MTITPARLATVTATSGTYQNARQKVLALYRDWQRAAPTIITEYHLDIPTSAVRAKIREEFEKHRYVNDLRLIDILLFKGRTEYQETLNLWKFSTHLLNYFEKEEAGPKPAGFLEKFYGNANFKIEKIIR